MMTMNTRNTLVLLMLLAAAPAWSQTLAEQFADPPHEYSLAPLWSWNGTLKPDELRRQIDEMVDKGVYGAFMHARAGIEGGETPYFSDGWWQAIDTCITHGAQVGFRPWIYDEDKWPSGAAGGRTLARNPEQNVEKVLRRTEQRVTGPASATITMPRARYVLAARIIGEGRLDPKSLCNLSDRNPKSSEQGFEWRCPEGDWLIMGYAFEPLPGHGVNYLNEKTVRDFMDITHEEYARRYGDQFGEVIPGIFFDEIANNAGRKPDQHAWVEGFEDRFRDAKGYDLAPLLPALAYDLGLDTPKLRCDYYDVYASVYEKAWFKQIADWSEAHGLMLTGHTIEEPKGYITQADYARTISHLQIPMTDNEDFRYTWPRTIGAWKPKQLASVGHLYGRPRTGVEAMGGGSWAFTPDMARYGINMLAGYGINFFAPHLFHYTQDAPASMDDWPNSWFYQNPYWKYFKTLADHARRVSFLLSGGQPVVDVAVLYPQTNQWAGYGPGTVVDTVKLLTAIPVDVDVLDPASLLRAETNDGTLKIDGMRYRTIILPGVQCIRRAEADKLREFVRNGGTLIVHDRWPTDSAEAGRDDDSLAALRQEAEAKGFHAGVLSDTPALLKKTVAVDVTVKSGLASALRYCHVRRDGRDIYWITNGSSEPDCWQLSFRAAGTPSIWQPEDGSIRATDDFFRYGDHTECAVRLDAWQGCFVVFEPGQEEPYGGTRIMNANLVDGVVETGATGLQVRGLLESGQTEAVARLASLSGAAARLIPLKATVAPAPATVTLNGNWDFLAVDQLLDQVWRSDVEQAELDLPVMRARWERGADGIAAEWQSPSYDHARWRQIKVFDTLHPEAGSTRYRSHWEGRFITYNPVTDFNLDRFYQPVIGGKGLKCRTILTLPSGVTRGHLAVVCPSPYRVYLNGTEAAKGDGGNAGQSVNLQGFRAGRNTLMIEADNAPALLAEGELEAAYGSPIALFTDTTWQASVTGEEWSEAWEYVAPPEAPYGDPAHPSRTSLPDVLWLRQSLPPGACALNEPRIEGQWQAWVNGKPLSFRNGSAKVPHPDNPSVLTLRVAVGPDEHGLLEPIRVKCRMTPRPLGSWTNQDLDWYSGRAVYARTFDLDRTYLDKDIHLELDLGRVGYCAEVRINGTLAGTRIWPPYRLDVTDHVRKGKNRIEVVVANLVANRMRWDIFDDVKGSLQNRKWHDDILRRDAWCFDSGLIGPVELKAYRRVIMPVPGE